MAQIIDIICLERRIGYLRSPLSASELLSRMMRRDISSEDLLLTRRCDGVTVEELGCFWSIFRATVNVRILGDESGSDIVLSLTFDRFTRIALFITMSWLGIMTVAGVSLIVASVMFSAHRMTALLTGGLASVVLLTFWASLLMSLRQMFIAKRAIAIAVNEFVSAVIADVSKAESEMLGTKPDMIQ